MAPRGTTVILARLLQRGGVVLVLAIFAVIIASAQAANSSKPYTANVHRTLNTPGSFTLTVTNDPRAQQSLGSANFTAPSGLALGTVTSITNSGFNVTVAGNVVQFRAKSSATALGMGGTVSADVTATTTTLCSTSNPLSGTWGVEAKQSNDFSGQPGNALNLAPGADLTPLGSFVFAPIEKVLTSGLHVPQILTDHAAPLSVTAKDTCGNVDADYSGGSFAAAEATPTRLDGALFAGPSSFSGGTGTGSVTPALVEAGDHITITDSVTGISGTSDPAFDVVETICAIPGTVCVWQNKNKSISASSTVPGDSGGTASLGFGFRALAATCGGHAFVGDGVDINPHSYTGNYQVTLTYSKSLTGNGPASAFQFCTSVDTVLWASLPTCSVAFPVDCIVSQKRVTGGALEFVLLLDPSDPWGGGFG